MVINERVLRFGTFLNESASKDKVSIIILSGTEKPSKTSNQFLEVCKRRKIPCHVVDVNNIILEKAINGHIIKNKKTGEKIAINPENTAIVPRRGVISNSHTVSVMRKLQMGRYFCVNTLESIEACENKFVTAQIMENHGLPVPKYALVPDENSIDTALKDIGGNFPVVMKLLSGSQGIGVSIVDSYASLKSVYQTIKKLNPENEILIQEKIDSGFDLRIQVLIKKLNTIGSRKSNVSILGTMKRSAVKQDFRTNYSLGGSVSKYNLSKDLEQLAIDAASAVGCHWCGVDIMIDKKTKKPYILEVNASPGTEGISKVIGKPIVEDVLDYILDKSNWAYSNLEIGYLENIDIPGVGTMVAKFDTGNGAKSCTIHADTMEIKGSKINWTIGRKKFSHKIVGTSEVEVGKDKVERPQILLDIKLDGVTVKDILVSPDDRTEKSTPFLANRDFMRKLGLLVNPNKAFVITEEPKDNFNTKRAKGDSGAGINLDGE